MNNIENISKMYFIDRMKQKDIAAKLNVSPQYISKVIKQDNRYNSEKQLRHKEAQKRKMEYNKQYYSTYERKIDTTDKEDYEKLQAQLDNDSKYMSASSNRISIDSYVKSNLSAYKQDKNGNLVLDKNIKASYALPKKYKRNDKKLYTIQVYDKQKLF